MSFDLALWSEPEAISAAEAQAKYDGVTGGDPAPSDPPVATFVEQLTARYPQIDDVDEDGLENCPWSCAFDYSDGVCIINMRWSDVDEILPEVVALAKSCGLLCYDPQNGRILTE
jgi:hypothetical protein